MSSRERLLGWQHAFDHPVTVAIVIALAALMLIAGVAIFILTRGGRIQPALRRELWQRYFSWLVLAPVFIIPVLLGAAWAIGAMALGSLLCYREYARATGLFRQRAVSVIVVVAIVLIHFAALDHWYGLFVALPPLAVCLIAAVALAPDQPKGYIQRVGLACLALLLIGFGLGHLSYFANDADYRPMLLMVLVCTQLNDILAYCVGKPLGRRKLAPNTSPGKTLGGALGAIVLTTPIVMTLGHFIFRGGAMVDPLKLLGLGLIVSLGGIMGDLVISSIKRDVGIKDMDVIIPGHGGFLDRFNSILLVAPAAFHYIGYFRGIGLDQPVRIFSGR